MINFKSDSFLYASGFPIFLSMNSYKTLKNGTSVQLQTSKDTDK